jgi:hypothetical protein
VPRYTAPMLWKCSVFTANELRRFHNVTELWSLLGGITRKGIWIERNHASFNDQKWLSQKVERVIWKSLLNYGRVAWGRCLWTIRKSPNAQHQYLRFFDKVWCRHQVTCKRDGKHIR